MGVFKKLMKRMEHYRQARAEREALRLVMMRKDTRLLRDAGLTLIEGPRGSAACEALTKEWRWKAPVIRLPSPSPRRRGEGDIAPSSDNDRSGEKGNVLHLSPSPRLRGEGDRQAG